MLVTPCWTHLLNEVCSNLCVFLPMHIKGKVSKSVNKFVLIDVGYVYVGVLLLKQHILWSFVICDVKADYLYNRLFIYTTESYPLITANYMISTTNWPLTQVIYWHTHVFQFFFRTEHLLYAISRYTIIT